MSLLTQSVSVSHYLVVGAILFVTGAVCMATKRNAQPWRHVVGGLVP